jgi:hypothetical protein
MNVHKDKGKGQKVRKGKEKKVLLDTDVGSNPMGSTCKVKRQKKNK